MARYIGCEHADLAVGDLAGRAGVLTADAARGLALLEKTSFVDDQHRIVGGERLHHIITHDVAKRIRIPPATAEDRLLPSRSRITGRLGPHPPGLAPLVTQ